MYHAWLDESGSNGALDPGTYILSAAIAAPGSLDVTRAAMRTLLLGRGHKKLHWREEDEHRQQLIAATIAELDVEHLVVVRSDAATTDRPERQRRLCVERMLPELVALGVTNAYFESRGRKDDRRDHDTLHYLRRKHHLGGPLHIDHIGGPADPMLWIPDACCGAITQLRCGDDRCYQTLSAAVTLIDIGL